MKITEDGLALIRQSEGLRLASYRDAVGVWTIGYGHTSAAGDPVVGPGQRMSQAEADAILRRDVEKFSAGVRAMLRREVSDQQFSALVSFAYNVGLGALGKSSVLRAANAGDHASVPQRLSLWVKAGGRTLPGLVKRRAAEASLYMRDAVATEGAATPANGKPPYRSTTIWAAFIAVMAAALNEFARVLGYGVMGLTLVVISIAAVWIIRERLRKSRDLGV